MNLEVSFRNLNPREEVRKRAQALYDKLERFLDPAAEGRVIIGIEHNSAIVELIVSTHGNTFKAQEEDAELRAALDKSFHRVEDQLRRHKEKRTNHKGGADAADGFIGEEGAAE